MKTRISEEEGTFLPNIFEPILKISPKPHFGGSFNEKPIIQRALSRTLMKLRR